MTGKLHTIGYEGTELSDFLSTLRGAGVSLVIDVRAVSVSRRSGFSKTALSNALAEAGINYRHLRDLGDPKPGREAAREGRLRDFERIYSTHLKTPSAQGALKEATKLAVEEKACLLCYEAQPFGCHRTIVAQAVRKASGLGIDHLFPATKQNKAGKRAVVGGAGKRPHAGEGAPTA
ncbi:DUF488 domain-containing protein [Roseomonas elaeocarpi]|uniref:DUF488 family protein n=1 Tax=Roseomonas elaeocarpi TaxID=907779 RepID=A0ABV6JUJ3_9PROT